MVRMILRFVNIVARMVISVVMMGRWSSQDCYQESHDGHQDDQEGYEDGQDNLQDGPYDY